MTAPISTPDVLSDTLGECLSEESIRHRLAAERARLLTKADIDAAAPTHFRRPQERAFRKDERERVTVLFGGLTTRHERIAWAGLEGLGYRAELIPTPNKADFQAGREYGNNGQCNPTYFTVGALVNFLKDLRDNKGIATERILQDYVFVTAGACGPCRFGMYEAEYRLALRNSGFDGFRVILFQQQAGVEQSGEEAGFEINIDFALCFLYSLFIGDTLNALAYQLRPYETVPGKVNEVFERCTAIMQDFMREKSGREIKARKVSKLLAKILPGGGAETIDSVLAGVSGDDCMAALRKCARIIDEEIEVDFLRPKPVAKITGEFWAQTTEGDGNFNMFPFLEGEGAEVLVEPIATWVDYLLHQFIQRLKDTRGIDENGSPPARGLGAKISQQTNYWRKLAALTIAKKLMRREYDRMREALGGSVHELADQPELQRIAHPYYNSRSGGGEGHLEVAKNIYYFNKDLAHLVLSLKPFGCMPSTQSDGAQAAVVSHFSDVLYLPIETSGEGDVNAHSRVQMALGEAKTKAQAEFRAALECGGYTLSDMKAYMSAHPELRKPLQRIPHCKGVVGRAANFALYVSGLMRNAGVRRSESVTVSAH